MEQRRHRGVWLSLALPPPPPLVLVLVTRADDDGSDGPLRPGRRVRGGSVAQRGLVTELSKPRSIVKEHARVGDAAVHRFGGKTLGFVTPWNARGYEFAERFAGKLDYVVPVWHQLVARLPSGPHSDRPKQPPFRLAGSENVDLDWVRRV